MGNGLLQNVADNVIFVLVCLIVAAALFLIAYGAEKYVQKRNGVAERILTTRKITMIGLFSALAVILFLMEFPIPFIARGFFELDFSEGAFRHRRRRAARRAGGCGKANAGMSNDKWGGKPHRRKTKGSRATLIGPG